MPTFLKSLALLNHSFWNILPVVSQVHCTFLLGYETFRTNFTFRHIFEHFHFIFLLGYPTFCANFQLQFRFFTASIPFVFCASSSWSSSTGSSTSRLTSSSASRRTSSSASRRMSSSASSRMSCPASIRHGFSSAYWDQSGTWLCFEFSQDIL